MIISTGVKDISVDAMPVLVWLTAARDNETPITGPNNVVITAYFMPFLSRTAAPSSEVVLVIIMMARKPAQPMSALTIVDAKGIMFPMSAGASDGIEAS